MENKENNRAQEIYGRFQMRASRDDEYNDWASYRETLTGFVLKNTPPGGSLLILGAGKCNDLDLRKLADHCGSITLSDYRPETVEDAYQRYGLTHSESLRFLEADYVGITDAAYLAYTAALLEVAEKLSRCPGNSLEEIAEPDLRRLEEVLAQIYRSNKTYRFDLGDKAYDNAVVAGVHSQLNNSFRGLFQYVKKDIEDRGRELRFSDELNAAIFQVTKSHTKELVDRFNQAVFAAVREGIVYGYEESILFSPPGTRGLVRGTVDGARHAGEAIASLPAKDRMTCMWPLSRRRNIRFEMSICYLPISRDRNRL